ncbi:unnamed protein product [Symbiodinium microadriaticum]|nr:unnamed protein product [Symbiodinium microadriaticum]
MYVIMGAMKEAGYRSAMQYLDLAKQEHIQRGHPWTAQHVLAYKVCARSCRRGLGPAKQASALPLDKLATLDQASCSVSLGPVPAVTSTIVASWWLLREIEASRARVRHVTLDFGTKTAAWLLPSSKTDVMALGAVRKHSCSCTVLPPALCPFHALASLIHGKCPEDPVFCDAEGRPPSKSGWADTFQDIAAALGLPLVLQNGARAYTGHSARATGAQFLATRGIELWRIQIFGRWGSDIILRYLREAPLAHLSELAVESGHGESIARIRGELEALLSKANPILAIPDEAWREEGVGGRAASGPSPLARLAVQLGLWAGQVDVFITAPSLALRDVTSCTAAPGSALLAVEVAVWDGIGCRLSQVSNPHPVAEIRLRLDAENRGTVAGTRDVLTMMINWASRTHFAAAREAYSIVPEFGGELPNPAAGAVLAFAVRGTVSPLTVHFPTAVETAYYATCGADMHLQLSLMRLKLQLSFNLGISSVLRIVASGRTLEARNWAMLPNNFDLSNVASSCKQFGILGALGGLLMVNVATVGLFWYDKHQAKTGGWRVPEKTLQGTAALGGWPAGYVAMQMFHHKTKKQSFRVGYHAATACNVGLCSAGLASCVGAAGRAVGQANHRSPPPRPRGRGRGRARH